MVRTYKKKLGTRNYKDCKEETIEKALEKALDHSWALNKAAKEYGIPYGTLYNKYKGLHVKTSGGQTIFTNEEEKMIIQAAVVCSDWGMPITMQDLRMITQSFLDRRGRQVAKFKNNVPGPDWVESLLKRHNNDITKRIAANIKKARAEVTVQTLTEYFSNLEESIRDIPITNLFNYDETNLADDPGKRQILCRRGMKYPENIINFSKSATTVMFCGSASGVLLPPYIIYKADHIWDRWTENGPKGSPCCASRCCAAGSRYNRTKSGWIDAVTFTDWFNLCFLPHAMTLPGRKVIISDNLAAHLTDEVIDLCQQNDITFLFLPRNSTHLTQPLDVTFFRPLKIAWRQVLLKYKLNNKNVSSVKKEDFPNLLKTALNQMNGDNGSIAKDLISGFSATGIYPLDRDKVLKKLPDGKEDENFKEDFNQSLVNFLKENRYRANIPNRGPPRKKKRINVLPGRSVTNNESSDESETNEDVTLQDESSNDASNKDHSTEEEIEYQQVEPQNLKAGTFTVVKFKAGKRKSVMYRYVAIVQEKVHDGEYKMIGLKSIDTAKKVFKIDDHDIFDVSIADIVAILPQPEIQKSGERLKYIFPRSVDVCEK